MVNPAPVRVPRKSTLSSPLVKAANKIVTSPTFTKARSIDFDKKNEYDKFIKFIESSNQELLRIKLPNKEEVIKAGGLDQDRGGGGGGLFTPANLLKALASFLLIKPLKFLLKKFIPRSWKVNLKRWWRNLTKPFRQISRFIRSLPRKTLNLLKKFRDEGFKIVKRYFDETIIAIKNIKNAKWIKNLTSKIVSKSDEAAKIVKEVLTNSSVIKTSKEVTEQVVRKAGPKISSIAIGELTVLGGVATDLSMAAYRLDKGDNTGALLSTLAAVPILGIPFNVVDVARDLGAFEDGGILDKIDFLDWFRLNKDNPNYVDKRTAEEKETDEDIDEYLKEIYKESLLEKARKISANANSSNKKATASGLRNVQKELRALEEGEITSDKLRSKAGGLIDDIKFFGKNKSSYDEIQTFLDNIDKSETIQSDDTSTTIINNAENILLPFNSESLNGGSLTGGESFNFNVNTSIIDFDYGEFSSGFADELLQLKLDK